MLPDCMIGPSEPCAGYQQLLAERDEALATLRAELAYANDEIDSLLREIDLLRAPVSPSNLRDLGMHLASLLDEDRWPTAERWLNAALSERASLIAERDAAIRRAEAAEKDAARIDWLDREFFERHWTGTIGEGYFWQMAGPFRHALQRMRGENLRAAIDAARAEGER